MRSLIAIIISQIVTSQLINRGTCTFSVEHVVNMVTSPIAVDRVGDKVLGL